MSNDVWKGLSLLGGLIALFAWSAWAGVAGTALVVLWLLWLVGRDALQKRELKQRCHAKLGQALAAERLELETAFYSCLGVAAIGVAASGRKFVYATPDTSEAFDAEAILEARARMLPQGDFEIGISVPGRVSGKPYWHGLLVRRRSEAVRWTRTLGPYLGSRMKADGMG